ncbi:MAG: hypothetical protein CMJ67_06615 [Planctomycetaceae bacterium]|nr:hypothetical protein [Planctomycetaceae bacterium]
MVWAVIGRHQVKTAMTTAIFGGSRHLSFSCWAAGARIHPEPGRPGSSGARKHNVLDPFGGSHTTSGHGVLRCS